MKQEHIKSYKKLLDKIRRNTYNIKKEDYQRFKELTKNNTVYSFFHFSNLLFQDKEEVGIVKGLLENDKVIKARLANIPIPENFKTDKNIKGLNNAALKEFKEKINKKEQL